MTFHFFDFSVNRWALPPLIGLGYGLRMLGARGLLREAGWRDSNNDGWLDKNGQIFEFTIITNQGNDLRKQTAEIIQRSLKDIGIKVKIRILEWAVFLNEFVNKKQSKNSLFK